MFGWRQPHPLPYHPTRVETKCCASDGALQPFRPYCGTKNARSCLRGNLMARCAAGCNVLRQNAAVLAGSETGWGCRTLRTLGGAAVAITSREWHRAVLWRATRRWFVEDTWETAGVASTFGHLGAFVELIVRHDATGLIGSRADRCPTCAQSSAAVSARRSKGSRFSKPDRRWHTMCVWLRQGREATPIEMRRKPCVGGI